MNLPKVLLVNYVIVYPAFAWWDKGVIISIYHKCFSYIIVYPTFAWLDKGVMI